MRYKTIRGHFKLVYELFIFRSVCINNETRLLGSSYPNRLSVSLSACLREVPTGRIFLKFDTGNVYENLSNIYIWLKSD
jgi:hypothetical protein